MKSTFAAGKKSCGKFYIIYLVIHNILLNLQNIRLLTH